MMDMFIRWTMIEDVIKILFGDSVHSKQLILYRVFKQTLMFLLSGFVVSSILFIVSLISAVYMQKIDIMFKEPERQSILSFQSESLKQLHERAIIENGAGICLPEDAWRYPTEAPHVKRKSTTK